jgi:hypothetical protein
MKVQKIAIGVCAVISLFIGQHAFASSQLNRLTFNRDTSTLSGAFLQVGFLSDVAAPKVINLELYSVQRGETLFLKELARAPFSDADVIEFNVNLSQYHARHTGTFLRLLTIPGGEPLNFRGVRISYENPDGTIHKYEHAVTDTMGITGNGPSLLITTDQINGLEQGEHITPNQAISLRTSGIRNLNENQIRVWEKSGMISSIGANLFLDFIYGLKNINAYVVSSGTSGSLDTGEGTSGSLDTGEGTSGSNDFKKLVNPLAKGDVEDIPTLVEKLLEIVLKIGAPLIAIAIIYSGYLFIAAQGDPTKLATAKQTLVYVVVGAAILLGAYVIAESIVGTVNAIRGQ